MPKIIENLKEKLIEEARRQILEEGYSAMTIRSVAKACGVGVGTVYNYFSSKEELVATFMLDDWKVCCGEIKTVADSSRDPETVLRCVYDQLIRFAREHRRVITDQAAVQSFQASFFHQHSILREQIAELLSGCLPEDAFLREFVAEALLSWTMSGKTFDEIMPIIKKLY